MSDTTLMIVWTAVASISTSVAAITGLFLLFRRPPTKRVQYFLDKSVRSLPDVPAGDVVAARSRARVDGPAITRVRIANTGRTSLPPDDWSGPLEVRTQGSNVLAASQSGARPIGLEVQIIVTGDRVLVEPFLFNARDLIELTITTDLPTTVLVHGRIKDVRNIGRKRYVYPPGTGVDGALTTADKVMSLVVLPALFVVLLVLGLVRGTAEVQMMAPWWFLGLTLGYFAFLRWSITRSRLWRPDLG